MSFPLYSAHRNFHCYSNQFEPFDPIYQSNQSPSLYSKTPLTSNISSQAYNKRALYYNQDYNYKNNSIPNPIQTSFYNIINNTPNIPFGNIQARMDNMINQRKAHVAELFNYTTKINFCFPYSTSRVPSYNHPQTNSNNLKLINDNKGMNINEMEKNTYLYDSSVKRNQLEKESTNKAEYYE